RSPMSQEAPGGSESDIPAYGRTYQATPQPVKSLGKTRKQQNRLDEALAFLRRELANGEVAATRLEEKAKVSGISTRTLDRARARLNIRCRRTGFAKSGKSWLSLPTTP